MYIHTGEEQTHYVYASSPHTVTEELCIHSTHCTPMHCLGQMEDGFTCLLLLSTSCLTCLPPHSHLYIYATMPATPAFCTHTLPVLHHAYIYACHACLYTSALHHHHHISLHKTSSVRTTCHHTYTHMPVYHMHMHCTPATLSHIFYIFTPWTRMAICAACVHCCLPGSPCILEWTGTGWGTVHTFSISFSHLKQLQLGKNSQHMLLHMHISHSALLGRLDTHSGGWPSMEGSGGVGGRGNFPVSSLHLKTLLETFAEGRNIQALLLPHLSPCIVGGGTGSTVGEEGRDERRAGGRLPCRENVSHTHILCLLPLILLFYSSPSWFLTPFPLPFPPSPTPPLWIGGRRRR